MPDSYEALIVESPYDTTVSLYHTVDDAIESIKGVIADCNLEPEDDCAELMNEERYFNYLDKGGDRWEFMIAIAELPA